MSLPVTRTDRAEADLAAALAYLDARNPAAADRLATAIRDRVERLRHQPLTGRARDDLRPGLRSVVVPPYLVLYRVQPDALLVVRILHGSRNLLDALNEDAAAD